MRRWLTDDQVAESQRKAAERLQAVSAGVQTVRVGRTEEEADVGAAAAVNARKRNSGVKRSGRKQVGALLEAVVLRDCSAVLDGCPKIAFWWRQNAGGLVNQAGKYVRFAFAGCSDLLACTINGRFVAVECKKTDGKPTSDQRAFLDNVRAAGGFAVCVDHPAQLVEALKEL